MATMPKTVTRGRLEDGTGNPIDQHVGMRIRQRRVLLGMTQGDLASKLSLTFQQVQKYERGANRVGASRLYDLARILVVPIQYFFDEISSEAIRSSPAAIIHGYSPDVLELAELHDGRAQQESLVLARSYWRMGSDRIRTSFCNLIKAMAGESPSVE